MRKDDQIELYIEDSGCGFDMESLQRIGSLGLISIRERARLVGGQVSIESEPGRGTRIFLRVPANGIMDKDSRVRN